MCPINSLNQRFYLFFCQTQQLISIYNNFLERRNSRSTEETALALSCGTLFHSDPWLRTEELRALARLQRALRQPADLLQEGPCSPSHTTGRWSQSQSLSHHRHNNNLFLWIIAPKCSVLVLLFPTWLFFLFKSLWLLPSMHSIESNVPLNCLYSSNHQ